MKTNTIASNPARTYEGAAALPNEAAVKELRRAVLSCLLFENTFYEKGNDIAGRISSLAKSVHPMAVEALAIEARQKYGLRHVSLFLALELVGKPNAARAIAGVIERPDELAECLALYWRGGRCPIAASVKRGLRMAFQKFNAHRFAKYDRDEAIKLRDVMFLVHPKPKDAEQAETFKAIAARTLATPDTWEVALSSGADKRATWERLLAEDKLGALALLRNLRNMEEAKVPRALVKAALVGMKTERVFPFRFVAAANHAPWLEPELELAMFRSIADAEKLPGRTALVIDTSPSMWQAKISERSEMTRFDAAAGLALLCREVCEDVNVYAFNERGYRVPPRRGFGLRDALKSTAGNYSRGGLAVEMANADGYDRIIVLTDGQWHTNGGAMVDSLQACPAPVGDAFLINVAPYKPALMTVGKWQRVDGWSERVLEWISTNESTA